MASMRIPAPQIIKIHSSTLLQWILVLFYINLVFHHIHPKQSDLIHVLPTEFLQERALKSVEHCMGSVYNNYRFPAKKPDENRNTWQHSTLRTQRSGNLWESLPIYTERYNKEFSWSLSWVPDRELLKLSAIPENWSVFVIPTRWLMGGP